MNKVTKTIIKLLENEDWFDLFPEEINHGNCDSFAYDITKLVPRAKMFWADEWLTINNLMPPLNLGLSHCFVVYRNKFYDSECPQGTEQIFELPFFKKQINS